MAGFLTQSRRTTYSAGEEEGEEPFQGEEEPSVLRTNGGHTLQADHHHAEEDGTQQDDIEDLAARRVGFKDDGEETGAPGLVVLLIGTAGHGLGEASP